MITFDSIVVLLLSPQHWLQFSRKLKLSSIVVQTYLLADLRTAHNLVWRFLKDVVNFVWLEIGEQNKEILMGLYWLFSYVEQLEEDIRPLGMNALLIDSQVSVSSSEHGLGSSDIALYGSRAWCAQLADPEPYVQVWMWITVAKLHNENNLSTPDASFIAKDI